MEKIVIVHNNPDMFGELIGLPNLVKPVRISKNGEVKVDSELGDLLVNNTPSWRYKDKKVVEDTEDGEDGEISTEDDDNEKSEKSAVDLPEKAPESIKMTLEKNFNDFKELQELAKMEKITIHPAISTKKGLIKLILDNWGNMSQSTRGKLMILDKKTK